MSFLPALLTWAVIPYGAPWHSKWGVIDMALAPLPIRQFASAANFILLQLPEESTALGTNAALREYGVAVRPFAALPHTKASRTMNHPLGKWQLCRERALSSADQSI